MACEHVPAVFLLCGWNVAYCLISTCSKKVILHLASQILSRALIGQVQAVFIHQHGLMLEPCRPGFLADVFPDALAKFAGVGRKVQSLGFFAELDAIHHACHMRCLVSLGCM